MGPFLDVGWVVSSVRKCIRGVSYLGKNDVMGLDVVRGVSYLLFLVLATYTKLPILRCNKALFANTITRIGDFPMEYKVSGEPFANHKTPASLLSQTRAVPRYVPNPNELRLIPLKTSDVIRPTRLISGHNIKKRHIVSQFVGLGT